MLGVLKNIWAYVAIGALLVASVLFYRSRWLKAQLDQKKRNLERLRASQATQQRAREASRQAKEAGRKRVEKARKKARKGKRDHFTGDRWD